MRNLALRGKKKAARNTGGRFTSSKPSKNAESVDVDGACTKSSTGDKFDGSEEVDIEENPSGTGSKTRATLATERKTRRVKDAEAILRQVMRERRLAAAVSKGGSADASHLDSSSTDFEKISLGNTGSDGWVTTSGAGGGSETSWIDLGSAVPPPPSTLTVKGSTKPEGPAGKEHHLALRNEAMRSEGPDRRGSKRVAAERGKGYVSEYSGRTQDGEDYDIGVTGKYISHESSEWLHLIASCSTF